MFTWAKTASIPTDLEDSFNMSNFQTVYYYNDNNNNNNNKKPNVVPSLSLEPPHTQRTLSMDSDILFDVSVQKLGQSSGNTIYGTLRYRRFLND